MPDISYAYITYKKIDRLILGVHSILTLMIFDREIAFVLREVGAPHEPNPEDTAKECLCLNSYISQI